MKKKYNIKTFLCHYRKDLFSVMEQIEHSKAATIQRYAKTLTESKLEQINTFGSDLSALMEPASFTENPRKPENSV